METFTGIRASKGMAKGRVRRIYTENPQYQDLRKGEILLTEYTTVDIAEYLSLAAAIITFRGSKLCHAAIVCREEPSRPCVVALGEAADGLETGDLVVVDGDAGTVSLLEKA